MPGVAQSVALPPRKPSIAGSIPVRSRFVSVTPLVLGKLVKSTAYPCPRSFSKLRAWDFDVPMVTNPYQRVDSINPLLPCELSIPGSIPSEEGLFQLPSSLGQTS